MPGFHTIAGALAGTALLAASAATAQTAPDPMGALRDAPAYDALHPSGPPGADPGAAPAAAIPDPMAAAGQPYLPAGSETPDDTATLAQGAPNPDLGNLPDGPGAEETFYQCVACHSTALIRQQRVTDERWDYLWHWMIEAQGMTPPDDETKGVILGYLKTHFSSER